MDWTLFRPLLLALGLGLLVGVERERARSTMAGLRTFGLITLTGALCRLLGGDGPWLPSAGLLAVAALFWVANRMRAAEPGAEPAGLTTEMAGLVMFLVGGLTARGDEVPAVVLAGVTAVLLHWKEPLHGFVRRLGEEEVSAVLRLVLLGMVILPVLPNRPYGPYGVLNPFHIWLMVVLIVGISLAAYVARHLVGARAGALLTGVLGGLVSSTATTVAAARRSREESGTPRAGTIIVLWASAVVFARVVLEVAVVAPGVLPGVGPPLVAMGLWVTVLAWVAWRRTDSKLVGAEEGRPPKDLGAAIAFGLLYAVVLFAAAMGRDRFGESTLYAVGALSGLADVDAITLSTARLLETGGLATATGWRVILVAALSNLVFKGIVVAALGHRSMTRALLPWLAAALAGGGLLLALWPPPGP